MGHPGHRENVPPGKMGVIAFVTFTMEKLVIWTLLLRYRWWIKMEMLMMMMMTTRRRRTTSENYQGYLKSICWASECGNFSHQQVLPHVYTRRWGLLIAKQQKRCAWFTYIAQFSPGKIICLKSLNIKRLLWMGCIFFGEGGGVVKPMMTWVHKALFPWKLHGSSNSFDLNPSVMVFRFGMGWEVLRSDISRINMCWGLKSHCFHGNGGWSSTQ